MDRTGDLPCSFLPSYFLFCVACIIPDGLFFTSRVASASPQTVHLHAWISPLGSTSRSFSLTGRATLQRGQ
mgnify:CR=1 FL=1